MEAPDFGFERAQLVLDGFNDEQLLASGLHLPFPAVNGLHRPENDGRASGQVFADDFSGDAASFDDVSASDQNDASSFCTRHNILPERMKLGTKSG